MKIRHAYGTFSQHPKSPPRASQSSKNFRRLKDTFREGNQGIRPPIWSNGCWLGRINHWNSWNMMGFTVLGEWKPNSGECPWDSGKWSCDARFWCLNALESSNLPPFDSMRYHWGEPSSYSAECRPQTAQILFFASLFPRAFRGFYPFCSLAYKYPFISVKPLCQV